jgi:Putative glycosyl/glycerophosphate transferases involved in teichoic acid biosynthesis TagF/TagB/EpsJ/RodC
LAKSGRYELILRPHPQSWRKEARFMRAVVDRFSRHDCFRVDRNLSPSESFERADVLVSDISGVRFEFAFLYERPVITLASEGGDDSDFEAADLEWSWERDAEREIGPVIGGDGIGDMRAVVEKALAVQPVDLAAVRARYVGCMGRSGEVIADWLAAKPDSVGA